MIKKRDIQDSLYIFFSVILEKLLNNVLYFIWFKKGKLEITYF